MTLNDNPTPPLTAEEIAMNWCWDNGYVDKRMADSIANKLEAYAAQRTAAKDARIAELGDKIKRLTAIGAPFPPTVKNLEAERDALKAKLDAANAQLAMVRGDIIESTVRHMDDGWVGLECRFKDGQKYELFTCDEEDSEYMFSLSALINNSTAEQWLAERDAALLKPWREALYKWVNAGNYIKGIWDLNGFVSEIHECLDDALKATEDLQ